MPPTLHAGFRSGYIYNLWALGSVSVAGSSWRPGDNAYLCAYNKNGTIENSYYATSDGNGLMSTAFLSGTEGTNSGISEESSVDNSVYNSNQTAKADEIPGTTPGAMLYTVVLKNANTVISSGLYSSGSSVTLPYEVDTDNYCDRWQNQSGVSYNSGSSVTVSGDVVFSAVNVQGKLYM